MTEKDNEAHSHNRVVFNHSGEHNYVGHKEMMHLESTALNKIIEAQVDKYHIFSNLWVLDFIDT